MLSEQEKPRKCPQLPARPEPLAKNTITLIDFHIVKSHLGDVALIWMARRGRNAPFSPRTNKPIDQWWCSLKHKQQTQCDSSISIHLVPIKPHNVFGAGIDLPQAVERWVP